MTRMFKSTVAAAALLAAATLHAYAAQAGAPSPDSREVPREATSTPPPHLPARDAPRHHAPLRRADAPAPSGPRLAEAQPQHAAAPTKGRITPATDGDSITLYDGKGLSLTIGGQIVPVVVSVDDGDQDAVFVGDGAVEGTRFWLRADLEEDATGHGLTYMGRLSFGLETYNPANQIRAERELFKEQGWTYGHNLNSIWHSVDDHVQAEGGVRSPQVGALWAGVGETATHGAFTSSLSTVEHVTLDRCDVGCAFYVGNNVIAPNPFNPSWTPRQVGDARDPTLLRAMVSPEPVDLGRIRLDTAEYEGLSGSVSLNDGGNAGLAVRGRRTFGDVEAAAAIGYRGDSHHRREPHRDYTWGLSAAAKHLPTGINAAFGYGRSEYKSEVPVDWRTRETDDYYYYGANLREASAAEHWHVALGWDAELTKLGVTAFLAVYGEKENSFYNEDRTRYWKAAVEQRFPRGLAVFASYARYDYDAVYHAEDSLYRVDTDIYIDKEVDIAVAGLRFRF